jgi:hypothetical protein
MHVRIYGDSKVEKHWAERFTFWNVVLNDHDSQFKKLLRKLDAHVGQYESEYGAERLRSGITSDPFSFSSELEVYDAFRMNGIVPIIEPRVSAQSRRNLDLSVDLDCRQILIEVIAPHPREQMVRNGAGFTSWDDNISRNIANEIEHHFEGVSQPTSPIIIAINGLYRGLWPINVESAVGGFEGKARQVVSAILLFASNLGPCIAVNPSAPSLTATETSKLTRIFRLPALT